jgi:hypothetical protein
VLIGEPQLQDLSRLAEPGLHAHAQPRIALAALHIKHSVSLCLIAAIICPE